MCKPRIDLPRHKNLMRFGKARQIHCKPRRIIVSKFRIICVAVLTASVPVLCTGSATAQNATPAAQASTPYLAGLRPPHEAHKTIAKTRPAVDAAKRTSSKTNNKMTQKPAAKITRHARTRPAPTSTARIVWPQVDPAFAEDRRVPDTALQFAADDSKSNQAQPNQAQPNQAQSKQAEPSAVSPAARLAAAPKSPPPKAQDHAFIAPAANDQTAAGDQPPEHSQPAAQEIARVEAPTQIETLAAASVAQDPRPTPADKRSSGSSLAPTLAMLAGAISAALFGSWLFGFGSARRIKVGV
jgi:hypothetical protein